MFKMLGKAYGGLLVLAVLAVVVTGQSQFDNCTTDADCVQEFSSCRCFGPEGLKCLCNQGYVISADGSTCVKASLLGEPCDDTTQCVTSSLTYCSNGACACHPYLKTVTYGDGRPKACVAEDTVTIGDPCNSDAECFDIFTTCSPFGCRCSEPDFRLKTNVEFWADADSFLRCTPTDFDLDSCPATTAGSTTTGITSTTADASSTSVLETPQTTASSPTTETSSVTTDPATTTTSSNTANIFSSCVDDGDCPANAVCVDRDCERQCRCDVGYVASADSTFCMEGKLITDPCTENRECAVLFSRCDAISGTCQCTSFSRQTLDRKCTLKSFSPLRTFNAIGEWCFTNNNCLDPNSVCLGGRCLCDALNGFRQKTEAEFWDNPYDRMECVRREFSVDECVSTLPPSSGTSTTTSTPSPTTTIVRDRSLGAKCSVSEQCITAGATCREETCGSVCRCQDGYRASPDGTTCRTASRMGETCSSTADCLGIMSYCTESTCRCTPWVKETRFGRCRRKYLSGIGESCSSGSMCEDPNAICPSSLSVCICTVNYHLKTLEEFLADPDDPNECAPDTQAQGCIDSDPVVFQSLPMALTSDNGCSPLTFSAVTLTLGAAIVAAAERS